MAEQPMKVLVVSDVHGRVTPLRWLLKNETADALFFLGDGLYDLDQAIAANGAAPDYPIYRVRGNCDIGSDDPAEGLAPFGGVLFFYTHGHLFGVKSGYERIAEYAADRGADVVLFGHTHYKTLRHGTPFSPALFNPGSLRDTHSYGVITITDGQCSLNGSRCRNNGKQCSSISQQRERAVLSGRGGQHQHLGKGKPGQIRPGWGGVYHQPDGGPRAARAHLDQCVWAGAVLHGSAETELAQPESLPLFASMAVADALEQRYGIQCQIKWPNDLLLNGKRS